MISKGVILAGGTGSRLSPLTTVTNKHLLPIYDKPMIYYPLQTLISSGIKDILIIAGRGHAGDFLELLGSGEEFNVNLHYTVQEKPGGIAQALLLSRSFSEGGPLSVILGDNIFEETFDFKSFREGARLYLKEVPDAYRFGVVRLYDNKITEVIEKPPHPPTNFAVTGLYIYDYSVFDIISCLTPSNRGELEITDVNNEYVRRDMIDYQITHQFWSDAGTFESLFKSSEFIRSRCLKSQKIRR